MLNTFNTVRFRANEAKSIMLIAVRTEIIKR